MFASLILLAMGCMIAKYTGRNDIFPSYTAERYRSIHVYAKKMPPFLMFAARI